MLRCMRAAIVLGLLVTAAACGPATPKAGEPQPGGVTGGAGTASAGSQTTAHAAGAPATCVPGPAPRLTIVTGPLPDGCAGGNYFIDGEAGGAYPVSCAAAPAGRHVVEVASAGDCAGMGECELELVAGHETTWDLRAGCPAKQAAPASACEKRYRRGFQVDLGRGVEELRATPNPHWKDGVTLDAYGEPCSAAFGEGWRVAIGSYSDTYLTRLRALPDPDLQQALADCPVTYRNLDTVCAPCTYGSTHCPCARRDVSDWLFCTR